MKRVNGEKKVKENSLKNFLYIFVGIVALGLIALLIYITIKN